MGNNRTMLIEAILMGDSKSLSAILESELPRKRVYFFRGFPQSDEFLWIDDTGSNPSDRFRFNPGGRLFDGDGTTISARSVAGWKQVKGSFTSFQIKDLPFTFDFVPEWDYVFSIELMDISSLINSGVYNE